MARGRRTLVYVLLASITFHTSLRATADTQSVNVEVLYPETLNDNLGNTADRNSNIAFADVPVNENYKSEGKTASDIGAIGPLYDLAKSTVGSSLPGKFPYEWAKKIKDGNIDVGSDWKKMAVDYLGYVIALAIGLIFILVFPIVGMCFCCCRCCGRCGGSRIIKNETETGQGDKCGRFTSMGILSAFTILAIIGSILMFVTSSNLSTSITDFQNNDVDKLDDLEEFFNFTVYQAEQLISGNFNFTLEVLFRDLDNIGYLLGIPIRNHILTSTGLGQTYDNIDGLDSDARKLLMNLETLKANKKIAEQMSEQFHNFTNNMTTKVEDLANKNSDFKTNVSNRTFVTKFNASQLPEEDVKIQLLNGSLSHGAGSVTAQSKKNLNDIPEKVQNDTQQERDELRKDVESYTQEVSKIITNLRSMKDDVVDGLNVDSLKDNAKDYIDKATKYDKYRSYGGVGLACVTMVNGLLLVVGILFGLFGGSFLDDPTKRGRLSNSGGNMLIAGVVIIFIFGWLVMLVTTILFGIGAPAEKFVCGIAQDLSIFDKLVDEYKVIEGSSENGSWLGNKVYSKENVVLKLSDMMESCKNGKTVYSTLKMEEAKVFNLSDVTDYNKKFSIQDKLGSTDVDFDNINITTGPMMRFIDVMKKFDSTMNYADYNTTLSVAPVEPSRAFLQRLKNFIASYSFTTLSEKQEFEDVVKSFNYSIDTTGVALETSINNINEALNKIKDITQRPQNYTLKVRCESLEKSLRDIEQNLSTFASQSFNNSLKSFEARLTSIMDRFITYMDNTVRNEMGNCRPVWNLYSDMVLYGVCRSTIGALNGWWCATGWTIFFQTLSIVAAVKLSKHFRRMRISSGISPNKSNGTHHFKNRVFHTDDATKTF